jgi:predicted neuraminidase/peroxiredoxin
MSHRLFRFAFFCLVTLALSQSASAAELGDQIDPLPLLDADGNELVVKSNPQRAATALVFLSSRSEAVEKTIADINQLFRKHRRLKVVYIGVCSNNVESAEELAAFARSRGMIFSIYRDPKAEVAKQLGVASVPSVVLLDHGGNLAHRGGLETFGSRLAFDAAVASTVATKKEPTATDSTDLAATPIRTPGQKRAHEDPYGSLSYASEFVFERIPAAAAFHCSTITQAANGDLLCLWYGGSYESADDQTLFLSRRRPGERNWSEPAVLIRGPQPLPGNGVIFVDGQKRVWIVWSRMEDARPIGRGQGWNNCRLMFRTSADHGLTWTKDAEFLDPRLHGVPRNPPVRRSNGDLVLAVEAVVDGVEGSAFLIGADGGKQWREGGFTSGGSQPAVIERDDRSLFALMRQAPRITQIESRDGGKTWSNATPSALRNPDSGISMTRLANGHCVVVFNDTELGRTPLSIARSVDEGRTWEPPLHLETNPGEYSYPCVIQTADGKIHVSYTFRRYTIKHAEFNEDWLFRFERPN